MLSYVTNYPDVAISPGAAFPPLRYYRDVFGAYPSLVGWWDCANTSKLTIDGSGFVSNVAASAPAGGGNLTAAGTGRPSVVSPALGGGLAFDGVNDKLVFDGLFPTGDSTLAVIFQHAQQGPPPLSGQHGIGGGGLGPTAHSLGIQSNGNVIIYSGNGYAYAPQPATPDPYTAIAIGDVTSLPGTLRIAVNGRRELASPPRSNAGTPSTALAIGAIGATSFFPGVILDVFLFSVPGIATEIQSRLEEYARDVRRVNVTPYAISAPAYNADDFSLFVDTPV